MTYGPRYSIRGGHTPESLVKFAFWVALLCVIFGCGGPLAKKSILMSAKTPKIADLKKIAVLPFEGEDDQWLTHALENFLINIRIDGHPHFVILDRHHLSAVLREQSLRVRDGRGDTVHLGKVLGADMFITGQLLPPQIKRRSYQKNTDQCIESSLTIYYQLKAIDVLSAGILLLKPYSSTVHEDICGENPRAATRQIMADAALENTFAELRRDIAPYPVDIKIHFLAADRKLKKNNAAYERFLHATKLAQNNLLDAACKKFAEVGLIMDTAAIYYNLGVCAEIMGELTQAAQYYQKAANTGEADLSLIRHALDRVGSKQRDLRELGRKIR